MKTYTFRHTHQPQQQQHISSSSLSLSIPLWVGVVLETQDEVSLVLSGRSWLSPLMNQMQHAFQSCFPSNNNNNKLKSAFQSCLTREHLTPLRSTSPAFMPVILVFLCIEQQQHIIHLPFIMGSIDVFETQMYVKNQFEESSSLSSNANNHPPGIRPRISIWNVCKNLESNIAVNVPHATTYLFAVIKAYVKSMMSTRVYLKSPQYILYMDKTSNTFDIAFKSYKRLGFTVCNMNERELKYFANRGTSTSAFIKLAQ